MASPTLVPRFGGQSYRKLITAYPSLRQAGGAKLRLTYLYTINLVNFGLLRSYWLELNMYDHVLNRVAILMLQTRFQ